MTEPAAPTAETPRPFDPSVPIVARAGRYYRNARYIMVVGLIAMGAYFAYDGYAGYPALNRRVDQYQAEIDRTPKDSPRWAELDNALRKLGAKKTETDMGLQKVLGFALPIGAVVYLIYFLRKSRGEIRLENDVLGVPGHPPIPLASVTKFDDGLWKKKGIARVNYDVDGKAGEFVLDDFVYQQKPTDAIYDRIVATRPS